MTTYLAVLNGGAYDVKLIQTGLAAGPMPGYLQSSTLLRVEAITQAAYNAIPVPSPQTMYVIIP